MKRINGSWVLVAGVLMSAACSDGTGPGTDQSAFDARKVREGLTAIEQVSSNPVLTSFRALSGEIPTAASGNGPAASRLVGVVRDIAGMVAPTGGPSLIPVIRSSIRGKTMVYDATANKYVVAEGRTGAPANGVRFILYEELEGRPNPAKEIGYSDLIDEKAASATSAGLRLKVVSGQVTHLDYSFDLSGSLSATTVKVVGFLSDGTERINFDLTTTGQLFGRGGTVTVDGKIEVPSQQFSITARLVGEAGNEGGAGQVDLTVKAGSDVIAVKWTGNANSVDAKVTVNGTLFATVTGSPANPVIRGEGGRELTAEEMQALGQVVEFAQGVFELIGGLLAPAAALLLLGLGL
ncbi:MAG: hypothetical protein ACKVZ0_03305 [Gemmatimonadales bacterium]